MQHLAAGAAVTSAAASTGQPAGSSADQPGSSADQRDGGSASVSAATPAEGVAAATPGGCGAAATAPNESDTAATSAVGAAATTPGGGGAAASTPAESAAAASRPAEGATTATPGSCDAAATAPTESAAGITPAEAAAAATPGGGGAAASTPAESAAATQPALDSRQHRTRLHRAPSVRYEDQHASELRRHGTGKRKHALAFGGEEGGAEEGGEEGGGAEEGGAEERGDTMEVDAPEGSKEEECDSDESDDDDDGPQWVLDMLDGAYEWPSGADGDIDWEEERDRKEEHLRFNLIRDFGEMPRNDEEQIAWVMKRSNCPAAQAHVLTMLIHHANSRPPDSAYKLPPTPEAAKLDDEDSELDRAMDDDPRLVASPATPSAAASAAPAAAAATSSMSPPSSSSMPPPSPVTPSAVSPAVASSTSGKGKAKAGPGAPARNAQAGKEAQAVARRSERLKHNREYEKATQVLAEQLLGERPVISSDYAAKQAKSIANQLFSTAGSLANAVAVLEKLIKLPEMRVLLVFVWNPTEKLRLEDRLILNLVRFLTEHLSTKGTRHAEDQNIHDALLTAMVDGAMIEDELINAVATLLGQRWHSIRNAIARRMKIEAEKTELRHGVWIRRARAERCDKFELQGFYLFCHDGTIFRFSSRHSEPLRKHVDVGEYEVRIRHRRLSRHHRIICIVPPFATFRHAVPSALV